MKDPNETVTTLLERLQASRPKLEAVETKTLGTLYLRRQNGEDQLKIHALQQEISAGRLAALPRSTFAAVVGAVMLLNKDGTPLFPDAETGYNALKQAGAQELDELYDALMKVQLGSGLEGAEKKSSSGQSSEPGTS